MNRINIAKKKGGKSNTFLYKMLTAPQIPQEYVMINTNSDKKEDISVVCVPDVYVPKICVVIRERLGNQLFEIISCWAYAKKHNMKLVLIESYSKSYEKYYNYFFNKIELVDKLINFTVKQYPMYESILNNNDIINSGNVLIYSYLQNANNFNEYRSEILDFFFNIKEIRERNNKFFIHIRLTDFLVSPQHNIDLDSYYTKAIQYISSLEKFDFANTIFYIGSDDIELAKKKSYLSLLPSENIVYIDNKEYDEIRTLELFQDCCKGAIIGHSSFGWWGAYMINCPEKVVICPNRFLKRDYDFSGFYLDYKVIEV